MSNPRTDRPLRHFDPAERRTWTPGISELIALRDRAATPEEAARLDAYIEVRRKHRRRVNAKLAAKRAARPADKVARILADNFPDGRQVCRTCGRDLPLSAFEPAPTYKVPLWHYCRGCQTSHTQEAGDHA